MLYDPGMSSIRLLRTFLAVAAEGSFAAAAPRVALTQAAVGQQMRALEAELKRPLFERQGKAVLLNEAGRDLVPQVRRLVAAWDQLAEPPQPAGGIAGTANFGAVVSAVRLLVQATLAMKERHPALEAHVSSGKSIELIERVVAGDLDAAIVVREPGAARPELAWTPLYAEPMVLLVPRNLPEAAPARLLQDHPLIRFDPTEHTGRLVERSLRRLRAKPRELLQLNALEGIADLVRAGLGVAVVPLLRDARWASDTKLRVVELAGAEDRKMALVQRRDAAKGEIVAAALRELRGKL
jgi:DNA-binding transcriptional LysR family regulator